MKIAEPFFWTIVISAALAVLVVPALVLSAASNDMPIAFRIIIFLWFFVIVSIWGVLVVCWYRYDTRPYIQPVYPKKSYYESWVNES